MYRKSQGPARAGGDLLLDLSAIRDTFVFEGSGDFYLPFLVEAIPSGAGNNPAPALGATITAALEFHYPDARRRTVACEVEANVYDVQDFFSTWRIGATEEQLKAVDFATFEDSFLPNATETSLNLVFGQPFFNGHDGTVDSVVFVHGWNMDSVAKEAFAETMYKRLYWQGFAGQFYSFEWPTFVDEEGPVTPPGLNLTFSPSEYEAWRSGNALKNFLISVQSPEKPTHLLAHSMGNFVTAEALRLWSVDHAGTKLVDTYVSMQGAVTAGIYGDNSVDALSFNDMGPDYYRFFSPGATDAGGTYWMDGARTSANHWVNMYNSVDNATKGWWPKNNYWKKLGNKWRPDSVWTYTYTPGWSWLAGGAWRPARFSYNNPEAIPPLVQVPVSRTSLYDRIRNTDGSPGRSAYEVLAFIARASAMPIGTKAVGWFDININLQNSSYISTDANEGYQHSFQFNNDAASVFQFYKNVSSNAFCVSESA